MMRSASRQALATLREQQKSAVSSRSSASTLTTLAGELYSVAGLLVSQPRLRRMLGDPATKPDARSGLLEKLVGAQVGKTTLQIATAAVSQRWSSPWDLTDAIEGAGDDALFGAAEKDGSLDTVEDELFRLERILQVEGDLTGLLDEQTVDVSRRIALLDDLLDQKVSAVTLALLHHAIASERKRSVLLAIDDLLEQAATRQERSVARVVSAAPLSETQQERLASALSNMYGRAISIRMALDSSLRGGLIVRVGDEVIDGSIAARFAGARTALAI
jgi:F-type H+-transporting ATPase subunit delta